MRRFYWSGSCVEVGTSTSRFPISSIPEFRMNRPWHAAGTSWGFSVCRQVSGNEFEQMSRVVCGYFLKEIM